MFFMTLELDHDGLSNTPNESTHMTFVDAQNMLTWYKYLETLRVRYGDDHPHVPNVTSASHTIDELDQLV